MIRLTTHDANAVVRALYVMDPTFTLLGVTQTPLEEAFLALTRAPCPSVTQSCRGNK